MKASGLPPYDGNARDGPWQRRSLGPTSDGARREGMDIMILQKRSFATRGVVCLTGIALLGMVSAGCSGGGSSGGSGAPPPPGGSQPPSSNPTFSPVSIGTPTYQTQVASGAQVSVTIGSIAGSPTPDYTVIDGVAPIAGGQVNGSSLQFNITAPTLNVGDPDMTWTPNVRVYNGLNGQTSEQNAQLSITVTAPTSGGGGGGGTTPPAVPSMSYVNSAGMQVEDNHHNRQWIEVSVNGIASVATSSIHFRFGTHGSDLEWGRAHGNTINVALPANYTAATSTQDFLVLTIDGYSGNSSVAIPVGNRTATRVSLNRSNHSATNETSRFGTYTVSNIGGINAEYEGNPNGFRTEDLAPLALAGDRVVTGYEFIPGMGVKAILLKSNHDGTQQTKIDLTTGLDAANSSRGQFVYTNRNGTMIAVVWWNPAAAPNNWMVSTFDAATLTLQRTIDTGVAKGNEIHRFGQVRWLRQNHVTQDYLILADRTANQLIAVGMQDGDVVLHPLGFRPEVRGHLRVRTDSNQLTFFCAGYSVGLGAARTWVNFGSVTITHDALARLDAQSSLSMLAGVAFYQEGGKDYVCYGFTGQNSVRVANLTDGTGFVSNLASGHDLGHIAYIPGSTVAFGTSTTSGDAQFIMVPVTAFSNKTNFESYFNNIPPQSGIGRSQSLGITDEQQFVWELRGTAADEMRVYTVGSNIPSTFLLAANQPLLTGKGRVIADRSRLIAVYNP